MKITVEVKIDDTLIIAGFPCQDIKTGAITSSLPNDHPWSQYKILASALRDVVKQVSPDPRAVFMHALLFELPTSAHLKPLRNELRQQLQRREPHANL